MFQIQKIMEIMLFIGQKRKKKTNGKEYWFQVKKNQSEYRWVGSDTSEPIDNNEWKQIRNRAT